MQASTILPFDGTNFLDWRKSAANFARNLNNSACPHGLAGIVMTKEEYAKISKKPFQYLPEVEDILSDSTPGDIHRFERWETQITNIANLRSAIIASLDTIAKKRLDAGSGLASLTVEQIMSVLETEYGTPNRQTLADILDALHSSRLAVASKVGELVVEHAHAHSTLAAAGVMLPEFLKVQYLLDAVKPHDQFAFAVNNFETQHPKLADQTFGDLSQALVTAAIAFARRDDSNPFAGGVNRQPKPATSDANAEPPKPAATTARLYCWTHGECLHDSRSCRKPAEGHVYEATKTNKHGGATTKWASRRGNA
jgi:hypothetical protein